MSEEDYRALLQYLRNELQRIGRTDLDEFAFAAIANAERSSDAFFKYAEALLQEVHLESNEGAVSAKIRLNTALQRAEAGTVEEIVLLLGDEERLVTGREEIRFEEVLPSRSEFLEQLGLLVRELRAQHAQTGQ